MNHLSATRFDMVDADFKASQGILYKNSISARHVSTLTRNQTDANAFVRHVRRCTLISRMEMVVGTLRLPNTIASMRTNHREIIILVGFPANVT